MDNRELYNKELTLLDILDTVLDKGVTIDGSLIISVADIDLVYINLKVLIAAVESIAGPPSLELKRGN